MKKSIKVFAIILVLASTLGMAACSGIGQPAAPTVDPNVIYTQAAETVQAQLTLTEAAKPTATMTPEPTATQIPPTATTTPTVQPTIPALTLPAGATSAVGTQPAGLPTATKAAQQSSGQNYVGDKAIYQYQVPADNKVFTPGETFMMSWGVKNAGSTTWKPDYRFDFLGGFQLSGISSVRLDKEVKPGEKFEFNLAATAPEEPGKYITRWKLVSNSGAFIYEVYFSYSVAK